jgi:hypothetical protein
VRPLCACGCGERVPDRRKPNAIYFNDACKVRASKARRTVADAAAVSVDEQRLRGLKPSARRVVRALMAAGGRGATTAELCQPVVGGGRFGARIAEARARGFEIDAIAERTGSYRYYLRSDGRTRRLMDVTGRAA